MSQYPILSASVQRTLAFAVETAKRYRHEFMVIEHLLYALLYDRGVIKTLKLCRADGKALKQQLLLFFTQDMDALDDDADSDPEQTIAVQRIIQHAAQHVVSCEKKMLEGVDILVALFEEEDSHAVYLLQEQNISRLDIVNTLADDKLKEIFLEELDLEDDSVEENLIHSESEQNKHPLAAVWHDIRLI